MHPPNVLLPVKIYDGIWIDCIHNQLLAILSKQNPSYMNMGLNLRRNYSVCRIKGRVEMTEDFVRQAVYPGYFVLEVRTELPQFGDAVAFFDYGLFPEQELHELIRSSLREGNYVFIKLDRYFIPGSKNSSKSHFANVALIYGYDDLRKQYAVLNDFRLSRTYETVELPYDIVYQAYHESTDLNRVFFHAKINEAVKRADIRISKEKICGNLSSLLDTRVQEEEACEWPGLERIFGFEAIREYAEGIEYLPKVMIDYLPAVYNGPLDATRLNLLILEELEKEKQLSALQGAKLKMLYGELRTMWELYRNKVYMYVARKQMNAHGTEQPDFSGLQKLLFTVYEKEKKAAEVYLGAISSKEGGN